MNLIVNLVLISLTNILFSSGFCPESYLSNRTNCLNVKSLEEFDLRIKLNPEYKKLISDNNFTHFFKVIFYNKKLIKVFEKMDSEIFIKNYRIYQDCDNDLEKDPILDSDIICNYTTNKNIYPVFNRYCNLQIYSRLYNNDSLVDLYMLQIRFDKYRSKKNLTFNFELFKEELKLKMNLKLDSVTKPFKIESNQNTIMSDDDPILYFEYWILIFLGTIISLSIIIGILYPGIILSGV